MITVKFLRLTIKNKSYATIIIKVGSILNLAGSKAGAFDKTGKVRIETQHSSVNWTTRSIC